jgi:20S proteasome alpha/beta subunit
MGSEAKNIEEQIIQDADGIIFVEESWKDFLYGYKDEMTLDELKKFTINKVNGMMNKIKTEEGIRLAKKCLNKTLNEIEKVKI